MKPGRFQSNHGHPYVYKKCPRKQEQTGVLQPEWADRAWNISHGTAWQFVQQFMQKGRQEGCRHPSSSRDGLNWW